MNVGGSAAPALGAAGVADGAPQQPLSLASLSDAQLQSAFDFLPLLQHTLRQMAHVSAAAVGGPPSSSSPSSAQDSAALSASTSELVQKLTSARDLLQLLPNIDVSYAEQMEESRRLELVLQRKRALLDAYNIPRRAPATPPAPPANLLPAAGHSSSVPQNPPPSSFSANPSS
jgi:hypothetical protein